MEHCNIVVFELGRFGLTRLGWRSSPAAVLLVLWGLFIIYGTTLLYWVSPIRMNRPHGYTVGIYLYHLGLGLWSCGHCSHWSRVAHWAAS